MAMVTKLSNQSHWSPILIFAQRNNQQSLNTKTSQVSTIRDQRDTCLMSTSNKLKWPTKPYEYNCKETATGISENVLGANMQKDKDAKHAKLVMCIRRSMTEINDESFEDLIMVDALQRLAIDYHFEDEINLILRKRYKQFSDTNLFVNHNLYEVSLCFRILRQNGFHVPAAAAITKFKGSNGHFDEKWNNDVLGLMALYEASQLSIPGETILDEAEKFTRRNLQNIAKFLDDDQTEMVGNTLENPYHKTLPLLNLKNSVKYYNGTVLQELAELECNKMHSIRKKELDHILSWWKELGLGQELIHARDQPIKWYLWPMIALTNPNHSMQRIDLTKTISLIYIVDDIFDIYGNIEELTIFTEAINRWDIKAIEQLPYYMKSTFKAIYDITNEIANRVYDQYGFNPISYLSKSWAKLCNAFLLEAKWFASCHIPKAEEYLENGMITSGIQLVSVHIFFLIGDGTNEEQANIINDNHQIISSVAKLLRLWDDLGSAKDENQDGNDGSYITCFVNEHEGCSTKNARQHVIKMISDTWKQLNHDCLYPTPFSTTFIKAANNIVKLVPLMYNYSDNGSLPLLNDFAKTLLMTTFE